MIFLTAAQNLGLFFFMLGGIMWMDWSKDWSGNIWDIVFCTGVIICFFTGLAPNIGVTNATPAFLFGLTLASVGISKVGKKEETQC